jgi:hypothetical protein
MTTTFEDVDDQEIERLARAIQAQLHPLTGGRSRGTAMVTPTGATPVVLPPNLYAIPVSAAADKPSEHPTMVVKVDFNPATEQPHKQGGDWTVAPATPLQVSFVANSGGARFNIINTGWKLRFDPPVPGLEPTAMVNSLWSGGVDGIVKACSIYEDADDTGNLFGAGVGNFPAIIISWINEETVEGRTAGVSQGRTRANRNTRSYYEDFVLYVVSTSLVGGGIRRREGLRIMAGVRNCLTDHAMNDDGEPLVAFGTGVEVMQGSRVAAEPKAWIYAVRARLSTTVSRVDTREWQPWNKFKFEASLPADPHLDEDGNPVPPNQTDELRLIAPKPDGTPEGIKGTIPQS